MSTITIKYNELGETARNAKKLARELDDYSSRITKKISNPIDSLPGSDKRGYASSIVASASAKIKELRNKSSVFDTYAGKVETFVANAQQADKNVEKSIKSSAESYIGKRSWWQAACDAVYNFLFVDLANSNDVFRFLSDAAKAGWSYVTSFTEKARDWFKHGAGKYVWNIVSSVVAVIGAVVGAIGAIAAIATAGTALAVVLAVVAAVAAVVGGAITIVNSFVKASSNVKALASYKDDPGVARYVGNIGSLSDAFEKYDLGDAETNASWEKVGKGVDITETVCDVIGIVKGITDLGAVTSEITGRTTGYKFNSNNVRANIKKSLGFDFDKNKYTLKGMFSFKDVDETSSWYANANGYGGLKFFHNLTTDQQNTIKFIADGNEIVSRVMGTMEKADSFYTRLKEGYKFGSVTETLESIESIGYTVIDGFEVLGNRKVFSGFKKLLIKPAKTGIDIYEDYIKKETVGATGS